MTDLPPLPQCAGFEYHLRGQRVLSVHPVPGLRFKEVFTAEQMHAYARAAIELATKNHVHQAAPSSSQVPQDGRRENAPTADADARKLSILATFAHEVSMGAIRKKHLGMAARIALHRVGLTRLDDVVALSSGAHPAPAQAAHCEPAKDGE
jgi:hypothetical protein